jgi:hypothetical protein
MSTRAAAAESISKIVWANQALLDSGKDDSARGPLLAAEGGGIDQAACRPRAPWFPNRMHVRCAELGREVDRKARTSGTPTSCWYYEVDVGCIEALQAVEGRGCQATESRSTLSCEQAYPPFLLSR